MRESEPRLEDVAGWLKVLGNVNRLAIVRRLSRGECAVSVLEQELGIRQPTLSQQLGELRKAGIVTDRREAKIVHYALAPAQNSKIRWLLDLVSGDDAPSSSEFPEIGTARPPQPSRLIHASAFGRIVPARSGTGGNRTNDHSTH